MPSPPAPRRCAPLHAHPWNLCAVPAVQIRVPGQAPLDILLALDSGPLASGLLGKTSLTYQLVGRPFHVAQELARIQRGAALMVRAAMLAASPVPAVPACCTYSACCACLQRWCHHRWCAPHFGCTVRRCRHGHESSRCITNTITPCLVFPAMTCRLLMACTAHCQRQPQRACFLGAPCSCAAAQRRQCTSTRCRRAAPRRPTTLHLRHTHCQRQGMALPARRPWAPRLWKHLRPPRLSWQAALPAAPVSAAAATSTQVPWWPGLRM